jgi:hypothetical protein
MEIETASSLKLIAAVSYCMCNNGTRSNPIYSENTEYLKPAFLVLLQEVTECALNLEVRSSGP